MFDMHLLKKQYQPGVFIAIKTTYNTIVSTFVEQKNKGFKKERKKL